MATALQVVQTAQAEMGLPIATSVVSNTDPAVHQFKALLNGLGQELVKEYDWQVLQVEHSLTTVSGDSTYSLPTDWDRYITNTDWNRTDQRRIVSTGPVRWSAVKSALVESSIDYRWRVRRNQIEVDPTPAAAENLVIEYISFNWLQSSDGTTLYNEIQNDDNSVLFDFRLLVLGLKLKWRDAKGFDITMPAREYMRRLSAVKATDTPASVMQLDGASSDDLMGVHNLAETGWGSA
jgi:hypothetical protein